MQPSPSGRVLFVDLARAVAVLFMVQGHALAVLLAPGYEQTVPFGIWLYLRGLTSCGFLTLSGFSFALATDRYRADYTALTPRLKRRLARLGLFLVLGYSMRIPVKPLSQLAQMSPEQWQRFSVVDVLQLVAVSLFVLQVLAWCFRTPRRFGVAALVLAAGVVLATPPVSGAADARVPVLLRSYLTLATGSLFPLFPWGAYLFFGAALGTWYADRRPDGRRGALTILTLGAAMMTAGAIFRLSPLAPYGPTEFWTVSPNLFLLKGGAVLVLLSGAVALTAGVSRLPRIVGVLSRESLLIYFAHLCVLYGSIWNAGLSQVVGATLGLADTVAWIGVLLAGTAALAWTWSECKRRWRPLSAVVRGLVAAAAIYVIT